MLSKDTVSSVVRHIKNATMNKEIKLKHNSQFDTLCQVTHTVIPSEVPSVSTSLPYALSGWQTTEHDEIQDDAVKYLTTVLKQSLGHIHGEVVPAITDAVEHVKSAQEKYIHNDITPDVVEKTVNELLYDNAIAPVLERNDGNFAMPQTDITTGIVSGKYVSVDKLKWEMLVGSERGKEMWRTVFNGTCNESVITNTINKYSAYDKVDLGIIMLVGGIALENNLSLVERGNVSSVRRDLLAIKRKGGALIKSGSRHLDNVVKLNKLVVHSSVERITVDRHVYGRFLDNGGSVEMLLGRALANDGNNSAKQILRNGIDYIKRYNRTMATNKALRKSNLLSTTKIALSEWCKDKCTSRISAEGCNEDHAMMCAKNKIKAITANEVDDIYEVCCSVVGGGLYYYTQATDYLGFITESHENDSDLNVADCKYVATMELLVNYMASQCYLET